MLTEIDIHQPWILSAMAALPVGQTLKIADVPAGASVLIRDNRWLEIETVEPCIIAVSVGDDAIDDYTWTRVAN